VIAHEPANSDRDWWTLHVLIAIFGTLVAAILRAVPGWSAPLHAWIMLTGLVVGAVAAHAAVRAACAAWQRRWRGAAFGSALAVGLIVTAAALLVFGRRINVTVGEEVFSDAPVAAARSAQ
jgi:hypothetical protein